MGGHLIGFAFSKRTCLPPLFLLLFLITEAPPIALTPFPSWIIGLNMDMLKHNPVSKQSVLECAVKVTFTLQFSWQR